VLRWNQSGITVAGIVAKSGNTSNLFNRPHGLVIDLSNTLYIADRHNHRIQKWPMNALTGITIAGQANGAAGPSVSDLDRPTDLAIDSTGNVYIADSWNHRIQFWENGTSQGSTIAGIITFRILCQESNPPVTIFLGFGGILNITLYLPYGLMRDPNSGILYIADTVNHRVIRYRLGDLVGTVVAGGNGPGSNNTQLSSPGGLYFDSLSNSLLIANSDTHNIVRWVMGADSWILVAGNLNGTLGNTSMELNSAFDVEVDPMGNVYVADRANHRIQFFLVGQSTGVTIAGVTGATGINSTRLNTPSSMTLDNQLNLYVADTNNHRIQKFLRY